MPGGPKCIKRSVKELKASFFSKISLIKWQKHNQIAASHALDACDETQNLHNWCVLTLKVYLSMSSHKLHLFTGFWSGRWAEVQQISTVKIMNSRILDVRCDLSFYSHNNQQRKCYENYGVFTFNGSYGLVGIFILVSDKIYAGNLKWWKTDR